MRRIGLVVLVAALTLATAAPAHAVVAAAGPGAYVAGWATPVVVAQSGGDVTVVNDDVAPHNLVASEDYLPAKVAKKTAWCSAFKKKSCPLFWSETITIGETTQVQGLENIATGQYEFFCSIHPGMTGTLVIPN
ncbi:MAG: cupredoxin domain-containing protein [Actinomycetota bacterium]